ncbi:Calcium-transporting ATPase 2 [Podosphaera aphanis]|nr:Calcium-transporting ATPase 2 [Podosphaera aphanis]
MASSGRPSNFLDGRRQRAPTITIETPALNDSIPTLDSNSSAVNQDKRTNKSDVSSPSSRGIDNSANFGKTSDSNLKSPGSIGSQDRTGIMNPHLLQSPAVTGKSMDFLVVPSSKSRRNSVDSEDGNQASTSYSGETYANSPAEQEATSTKLSKNYELMNDPEALKPDPGTEADFSVDPSPFSITQGQLNKLINPKSLAAFYALGGIEGIEKGLRSDRKTGLHVEESTIERLVSAEPEAVSVSPLPDLTLSPKLPTNRVKIRNSRQKLTHSPDELFGDRKRVFKDNRLPVKHGKSILQLMWITYNDKVLILLSLAAIVSLGVGLFQTFGTKHDAEHPPIEWVEGVAIVAAILIVVIVGSLNDWQKERQFVKLNSKKQDRTVNVVRSGKTREISVFDVMVGDVMHLEPGDMIPVDGIVIQGHNIKCDESQTTGESDLIRKAPADQVYAAIVNHQNVQKLDPFILSGSTVIEGMGTFLVTSTGVNSSYGKTLMSLREDPEVTPLQSKLNNLAEYIAKLGGGAGLALFLVLFIEFLARLPRNDASPTEKAQQFLQIFIVTVTVIVVAVPEGLPLAVTLALAFATTRMLKDNNLVRHLKACEVMGNASTICSDKTGTLTQNKMLIVAGTIGQNLRFVNGPIEPYKSGEGQTKNDIISAQEATSVITPTVKELLKCSIVLNSTAFEGEVDGKNTFIGSKTETAMLIFARELLGIGPVEEERTNAKIIQLFPFDSGRKCMGVVVQLENGKYRLYVKGASEILLEKCSAIIQDPTRDDSSCLITEDDRRAMLLRIDEYASRSLRTIALVYHDFEKWPPKKTQTSNDQNKVHFAEIFKEMILLAIVGIQDPLRDGVILAVKKCQNAGVVVRMVTGDNINTAKAIALECGILTEDGVIMEGPAFRKLNKAEMDKIIPRLQVLARSSPEDKRILVKSLKNLGETVAVTGDGTNDAPALKTADVGFSMGISGTEVSKEASAIILMDDNFASIVKAMMWGRAVNDAVKKFLQFQVTVNITAVLLTFITAVSSSEEKSVLTAVQLLWVNLIMDTMAALALATDPPTESILNRKSEPKSAPLISITMWKMIIGESIYQLAVTLALYYGAASILSYETPHQLNQIPTLVFNTFVWMQIFNQWNNRRLDNKLNIFEGVSRNYFFIIINVVMIVGQVMIIFVGGKAFNVVRLDGVQWAYCLILGFISIPIGLLIRFIPDEFISSLIPGFLKSRHSIGPELTISDEEQQFSYLNPLVEVKEELSFLRRVKGGRLNNLKFAIQDKRDQWLPRSVSCSRSGSCSSPQTPNPDIRDDNSLTQQPPLDSRKRGRSNRSRSNSALGATTVMAGIIAGSVAGWSSIDRPPNDNESLRFSPLPEVTTSNNPDNNSNTKVDGPNQTENSLVLEPPLAKSLEGSISSKT